MSTPLFPFDNRYAQLEGLSVPWQPATVPTPRWLRFNHALALELGLDGARLGSEEGLAVLSGNRVPDGAQPVAQAYAGHQFGGFSPQLGDGRALLLGEILDPQGRRRDIAFKGSGRTPFSRGGDGKAAVGPVLREYLISEAMYALGIPTTRTLAAVATGETISRERPLPGAILARVASSHIRVGSFQFFAARRDTGRLRTLADHAIERHDPSLAAREDRYLALLEAVAARQAKLIALWMSVGFIHGVMNTDNMTVSGETIDYGPCAFMEAYDPGTVFSSIDSQGRYAFGNQPGIAQWNLTRLAEALLPLIDEDSDRAVIKATQVIEQFPDCFSQHWLNLHRAKLGLQAEGADNEADRTLANELLRLMHGHRIDFTLGFRRLSAVLRGQADDLRTLWGDDMAALGDWLDRWQARVRAPGEPVTAIADRMDATNPIYIPRNHLVENALDAAVDDNDLRPFEKLLSIVTDPFTERSADAPAALPGTPEQTRGYRTFCGT